MPQRSTGSPDDWFRSDAWDAQARELFDTKLARARSGRVQYLRIKGLMLTHADDSARVASGRQLLQRVIDEHPEDGQEVSGAHYALGDSFAREGRRPEAEQHLRACLALEPKVHVFHNTELRLAEVLIDGDVPSLDEAWELLNVASTPQGVLFHNIAWRVQIARARLRARQGDRRAAATHARNALAVLDHNEPQFSRHPDVGLIIPDRQIVRELKRLARH
jgi:uncharacterized protein HemY